MELTRMYDKAEHLFVCGSILELCKSKKQIGSGMFSLYKTPNCAFYILIFTVDFIAISVSAISWASLSNLDLADEYI